MANVARFLRPLIAGVMTTMLLACLQPSGDAAPNAPTSAPLPKPQEQAQAAHPKPEPVGPEELGDNPAAYAGRFVMVYVMAVRPQLESHPEESGCSVRVDASIGSTAHGRLKVCLTPDAARAWETANLSPKFGYTVTFTGIVKPLPQIASHGLMADSVTFNAEYQYRVPRGDGFPSTKLSVPRPTVVSDVQRIAIFPQDYVGKLIRFDAVLGREGMSRGADGGAVLKTAHLDLVLSADMAREVFDKTLLARRAEVVGRVEAAPEPGTQVRVRVTELSLL